MKKISFHNGEKRIMPKRIGVTLEKALGEGLSKEVRLLDCYNNSVLYDYSVAITTRINGCNHYWIMNIDE